MSGLINRKAANTSAIVKVFKNPEICDRWSYTSLTKTTLTPTQIGTSSSNNINVLIKGDLTVNGSIINPSDSSIKENVEDINTVINEDILKKMMMLGPKKYNLKYNKNKNPIMDLLRRM